MHQDKILLFQKQHYKPALTASFAIAVASLELEAIFSPHLIASGTS